MSELSVAVAPCDALRIQMVGRLVQQQDVGRLQQQAADGYATALTTAEILHERIPWRAAQSVHRAFLDALDLPPAARSGAGSPYKWLTTSSCTT
jgi:hypothetical protein